MEKIKAYRLPATLVTLLLGMLLVAVVAVPVLAQNNPTGTNGTTGAGGTNAQTSGTQHDCSGQMGGMDNMMDGMMNGSNGNTMDRMDSMMGDVDRHFIEQMIPHHQAAIDMADLALQKAQRPEIKTLAANIKRVQTDEITQMRAWYKEWYGTDVPAVPTANTDNGQGMMSNSGGMMDSSNSMMGSSGGTDMRDMMGGSTGSTGSLADLAKAADFDKAFIEAMIPHHQMALMMSTMVLAHGEKAELNNLAQSIITSQSTEIQQMRTWYKQWYNSAP